MPLYDNSPFSQARIHIRDPRNDYGVDPSPKSDGATPESAKIALIVAVVVAAVAAVYFWLGQVRAEKHGTKASGTCGGKGGAAIDSSGSSLRHAISSPKGVVVMFYAPWCSHCKAMSPAYDSAAARTGDGKMLKVNGDPDAGIVTVEELKKWGVEGFPTVLKFENSRVVDTYEGDRSESSIASFAQK